MYANLSSNGYNMINIITIAFEVITSRLAILNKMSYQDNRC